jgi:hypothetical protein
MRKWEEVFGGNRSVGLNSSPQGCTWIEKGHSVRRIVIIALSVMLALVVAMPMVSGKPATTEQKPSPPPGQLKKLTAEQTNWAFSTNPSPLEGGYTNTAQCDGEYVEGVFFLAAELGLPPGSQVERICTVPADTPIQFPVFNYICSAAFDTIQEPDDPKPYHTKCAEPYIDAHADPPSTFFATLDGQNLTLQRIASGQFWWTIPEDASFGIPAGTYRAAQDGLWVYLEEGLAPGEHTIVFKGSFEDTPGGNFEGTEVTYHLTAV